MTAEIIKQIEKLTSIGISLSKERNSLLLLEKILEGAKDITSADAGTLYLVKDKQLHFEILQTDSMSLSMGGTSEQAINLAPIPLIKEDGEPNLQNVSAYTAVTGQTTNIPDAYSVDGFNFQGTKIYDQENNYRSKSFLTIPMRNHEDEIIGVLQLINAQDRSTKEVVPFSFRDQKLAESLTSQAAITLTNYQLIGNLKELLEKFIEMIANAIDDKSPYTGGHCRRVPEIASLIADAINKCDQPAFKNVTFNEQDLYELNIAALLHDCGKITTPVHVVDKATKLETINDRISLVAERVEILKKEAEIHLLKIKLESNDREIINVAEQEYQSFLHRLDQDFVVITQANKGSEFMGEEARENLKRIAEYSWQDAKGNKCKLLNDDELLNLSIAKGTLNEQERKIVNHHIVMSQSMLSSLPFPKHLKNVPEIAGNHHERMDGKGYPNGIEGKELSIQARLMCIADIFEALTADDRPYKKAMNLSTAITILGKMKLDSHIDGDLFDLFVSEKIYLKYAEKFLSPEQIDEIDIQQIPGYGVKM